MFCIRVPGTATKYCISGTLHSPSIMLRVLSHADVVTAWSHMLLQGWNQAHLSPVSANTDTVIFDSLMQSMAEIDSAIRRLTQARQAQLQDLDRQAPNLLRLLREQGIMTPVHNPDGSINHRQLYLACVSSHGISDSSNDQ